MSLGGAIRNITGPVVKRLLTSVGDRFTFRRITANGAWPNGTPRKTWGDAATQVPGTIYEMNVFQAQAIWGQTTYYLLNLMIPKNGLTFIPNPDMGVVVTSGPYVGQSFSIAKVKPDDLGQNYICALIQPQESFS